MDLCPPDSRIGIIGDEVSQDHRAVVDFCLEHRLGGIEIRSVWGTPPLNLSERQCADIRRMTEDSGLEIIGFDSPVGKVALTDEHDLRAERDRLSRALEQADRLGAELVRVFAFLRDEPLDQARLVESLHTLYGDHAGPVRLVLETGTETFTPTLAASAEMLALAGLDHVGILWDPGNTRFAGCQEDTAACIRQFADRIIHVHVKDPDGTREYVKVGEGDVDWRSVVALLVEVGYAGWYSFETHYRPSRALTPAERRTPWGASFSAGGDEASRICIDGFRVALS